MKKFAFLLAFAALLAGCADSTDEEKDMICGHGHYDSTTQGCVCDVGYVANAAGVCVSSTTSPEEPKPPKEDCVATFYYTNPSTHKDSGGADDFDVHLVGDFNNWKEADPAFKMTYMSDGTHAIKVKVNAGATIQYKYYVNGWAENSWQSDAANPGDNATATFTCGMSIGQSNGKSFTGDATATISTTGTPGTDKPVTPQDGCKATFQYVNKWTNIKSGGAADFDVYLIGDFNEWKEADTTYKMTSDGNGTHTITMDVTGKSTFLYKFFVNGWEDNSYHADPNASTDDMGNNQADGTCGKTYRYVEVDVDGSGTTTGGESQHTGGSSTSVTPTQNCYIKSIPSVSNRNISFEIACNDGSNSLSIISGGSSNATVNGMTVTDTVSENGKYSYIVKAGNNEVFVPVWVEDKAFDWHDALLYFAFTDRFYNGDTSNDNPKTDASIEGSSNAQWLGGDFKGLQEKVEAGYFRDLGVNTLWISSVSMNAQGVSWGTGNDAQHKYSAYHSYWPVASFYTDANKGEFESGSSEGIKIQAIEPHFGTLDDLKSLVNACHKQGIRVLVDFAANQVHKDSPMFQKHPDWFNDVGHQWLCDDNNGWDNYSEKCWFSQDLPDINYENGDARKAMVDHAIWLIKTTDIDGFRVDAVKHMNVQFIKDLRAATDQLYNNSGSMFYMVGETFTGDVNLLNKYIGNDLLHAQFDFPMYYAIQNHVLGLGNYADLANLSNQFNSDLMGTFMGNHDVARAISVAAHRSGDNNQSEDKWKNNAEINQDSWGDAWWQPYLKVKTALTILLTNPGVPLIYYGDEYGMEGANDPDNRRMMEFGDTLNEQQKGMLGYVQQLGQIRKNHSVITRGKRKNLSSGGGFWCYALNEGNDVKAGSVIVGVSRYDGDNNSGCSLNGSYTLQNLLDPSASDITADGLDLSVNRLQIYLVK